MAYSCSDKSHRKFLDISEDYFEPINLEKSKEVENYPRIISEISRNSSGVRAEIFNIVIGLSSKA